MQKIGYYEPELTQEIRYHSHDYAQIVLQTKGDFYLSLLDKEYLLTSDVIAFVPTNCLHGFRSEERDKTILFNVPAELTQKRDSEIILQNPILKIGDRLRPIIDLIRKDLREDPEGEAVKFLFYYLYNKFLRQCQIKSVQYINDHYSEELPISQLAAIENYNVSYYTEWFKQKTGFLPSEFIQNTRIEQAKVLLLNTDLKINEIANRVGYKNNSAFARTFSQVAGVSPKAYRDSTPSNHKS